MLLGVGGTSHPLWRQLLASVLERPLRVLPDAIVSAIGAALLGGMAVGAYPSHADDGEPRSARDHAEVIEPGKDQKAYAEAFLRYVDSYPRRAG